jgi:hypothetical protein
MGSLAAIRTIADAQVNCLQGVAGCSTGLPVVQATNGQLTVIMQLVFGVIGAATVIIVIIGALSMSMAEGDAGKVAKARQTVIFALIGLFICVSAEAIIAFVVKNL